VRSTTVNVLLLRPLIHQAAGLVHGSLDRARRQDVAAGGDPGEVPGLSWREIPTG